jgi:hypothetical protein
MIWVTDHGVMSGTAASSHGHCLLSFLIKFYSPISLPDRKGTKWKHEDGSETMLEYLIDDNEITIPREDCDFVKALIAGDPSKCQCVLSSR